MRPEVIQASQALLAAQVSVTLIAPDGAKASLIPWHPLQLRRASDAEVRGWMRRFRHVDCGLAIVAGRASGNVEIIDFDTTALVPVWDAMIEEICPGLLARLVLVQTPRPGRHVYYRCAAIAGNQKLAQELGGDGKPKTLIETRGLGGYALIPPSPPTCHELNRPYALLQGDLTTIPEITPEERDILLNSARTFNTYVNPARVVSGSQIHALVSPTTDDRPGDLFTASVSWAHLLEPSGWTLAGSRGALLFWRRPGKHRGWSATTGLGDTDLLYVFTTNAPPFEAETCYTRFGAYAVLEHQGDFSAAARVLALLGYRRSRISAVRFVH